MEHLHDAQGKATRLPAVLLPRRPATNPLPTSHHEVLLNPGMAATVSEGVDSGSGSGGRPTGGGGGRRPRPLAIPTDLHYNVSSVLEYLLIGGDEISDSLTVLRQFGVKGLVNATAEGGETLEGMCYVKLNWSDEITQPILPDLDRAFACIEEARRRGGICLVFCKKGMSRSGAVVVAYLMKACHMSLWEALTFARSKRAIIAPNIGFMAQLIEYERGLTGRATVDLDAYENNRFGDTAVLACGA